MDNETAENKSGFSVHLENFTGPFDVLLSLISKHKLNVTQIALSQITDEFVAFVRQLTEKEGDEGTKVLDEISSFILIAATLLEIKTARLLPGQESFNEEDLELLEARDLLFAKLLQYKAYKDVAQTLAAKFELGSGRYPHIMALEDKFAGVLPELVFNVDTRQMVLLAAGAFAAQSYRNEGVSLDHIHMRQVNVAQQGIIIAKRLIKAKELKFSELIKDAKHAVIIIGRFLSLLELYKMNAVEFSQPKSLGELTVKWVAPADFNPDERMQGSDFDTPVTAGSSVLPKGSGSSKNSDTSSAGAGANGAQTNKRTRAQVRDNTNSITQKEKNGK